MTEDERALLIKTAQALGSLSKLLSDGCGLYEFGVLAQQIDRSIAPLVRKLTS